MSGLDRLGPGSHVCCVVDSSARFEEWTAACLAEGAGRGEKLFRFGPRASLSAAREAKPDGLSVTVADPRVAFLAGGPVDPAAMYAMFRSQAAAARREGFEGLRLVADMDWLLAVPPSREELTAFELLLDEVVTELGATVVCAYRTEHFDAATIAELAAVHPITVGTVTTDAGFRLWNVAGGVWQVRGEIDHFNAEPFERALATAAAGASTLRLKAAGLTFTAVAGIHAIVRVASAHPDLWLVIEDASEPFWRCWTLFDLDQHLPKVRFQPQSTAARHRSRAASPDPGDREDPENRVRSGAEDIR